MIACKKTDASSQGAPAAKSQPGPEAPSADAMDLSPGGQAWNGWTMHRLANAKLTDDGAGEMAIETDRFTLTITQAELDLADMKASAKLNSDRIQPGYKPKIDFTTDTADDVEWVSEMTVNGRVVHGYGFGMHLTVGGKKIGCTAVEDTQEQMAAAKAACQSVAMK